jgi:hypothetical protein
MTENNDRISAYLQADKRLNRSSRLRTISARRLSVFNPEMGFQAVLKKCREGGLLFFLFT